MVHTRSPVYLDPFSTCKRTGDFQKKPPCHGYELHHAITLKRRDHTVLPNHHKDLTSRESTVLHTSLILSL